jgi:2-haloacid dehalogenase
MGGDILGAMKAGCQAALVKRPGKTVFPLGPQPLLITENLIELADQIISSNNVDQQRFAPK